uniref:CRTAC1 family protein n=1 Tax=Schlesneria paludicola TaxID=360056 RepID=A0A7C2JZH7_9PLAN
MKPRSGPYDVALAAAALLCCCGCPSKPAGPPTPPPAAAPARAAIDCATLWPQKNLAVGLLENEKYAEAAQAFQEIAAATPSDPLGSRNLVIARLQGFKSGQASLAEAEAAVEEMLAREPQSLAAWWLAARVAVTAVEQSPEGSERDALRQKAVERFDRALALNGDIAALHYELFDALRYSTSPDQLDRSRRALQEAQRLAPENLFVLSDLLAVQAEQQDAGIAQSLSQLAQVAAPLREGVQKRARVDVQNLIDEATAAATAGTWPVVNARVRALGAVLRPEEQAQSDRRRLMPHPLEFVLHDFQATTCLPSSQSVPTLTMPTLTRSQLVAPLDDLGELRGMTTVDFNLDGRMDIICVGAKSLVVLQQSETATWGAAAQWPLAAEYNRLVAVDFDRDATEAAGPRPVEICQDADPDVLAFGPGGVLLLRNDVDENGQRTLSNTLADQPLGEIRDVLAATPADFDHDGDLDLVLSTAAGIQLWSQQGALRFVDVSAQSQLPPDGPPFTKVIAVDLDRDVDLDVVVVGPDAPLGWLENLRHGELRYRDLLEGAGSSTTQSLAVIEADGNVSWDLVVGKSDGLGLLLSDTPDRGTIRFRQQSAIVRNAGDNLSAGDLNNDAAMDLLFWSAEGMLCILGRGDGTFSPAIKLDAGPVVDAALADVDADGDLDVLAMTAAGFALHRNELAGEAGWLTVRVRGIEDPQSGRVNQYGVGSLVELRSGGRYQAQVITGPTTHFGLGSQSQVDSLRVLWTNGVPQVVMNPQPNQSVCERMALKGSCPYLYTWTGERFEFFTDLLWAAPLGLQLADGVLAPSRPWEYLLVPGEACQPRDGRYELQITEELWEAAYFDQVELLAIDHPADVEVFSNEKVGPAEIAEMKVHTVRQRRTPVAARDQRGRDVLDQIRGIDGNYLKAFDRELRQGLTEPHYLELDLGPLEQPQRIMLFLTGWIYPTDTSLNVALSQDPDLDGPRPPSLWTPDERGAWREVRPFLGFPGGKTKTIAIDVSDAFAAGDYRLRIATTHEIYWDAAFFTVDEPPADVRVTPLKLVAADLHPRGFSQPHLPRPNAPETYDYSQVSTQPKWPPMAGWFTRYGDVRELLETTDDRLLVMASGDEVTVTFAAPPGELPAGWRRDFFLHNVGWDKDADLHTVYGQTVEPLPFVEMSRYPYPPDGGPADSAAYREYLRLYQTRAQSAATFWRGGDVVSP